jgi:hypothetical protein
MNNINQSISNQNSIPRTYKPFLEVERWYAVAGHKVMAIMMERATPNEVGETM